ncbi:DinI-like family protein [Mangrovibacter sp. SLW1]
MRVEIMIDKEQQISQDTLEALETELYRNLRPVYPDTSIRIRKASATGLELSGLKLDEDKKHVMTILQQVWEDEGYTACHRLLLN